MKLRDCVFLLPTYELDGFPRSLPAPQAREVLSGWLALWHPRLLAAIQSPPRWQSAAQLPGEPRDIIFVLPSISVDKLASDGQATIEQAGGLLLRVSDSINAPPSSRHAAASNGASNAVQSGALAVNTDGGASGHIGSTWRVFQDELLQAAQKAGWLDSEPLAVHPTPSETTVAHQPSEQHDLTDELRDDFAALGYAFLQMQLMTRQLRYTSNLDMLQFAQQLTSAAQATLDQNRQEAERWLQACFDALGQERDHYYSLDVHLLDVTLLAPSTLGKSLATQLQTNAQPSQRAIPTSYLAAASLLQRLQTAQPERLSELQRQVSERGACLVGGLDVERPHPLANRESIARDFARGREVYTALGLQPPRIFARHSFGLSPEIVPMLRRWGYEGCLLVAWSGGSYPQGAQPKISWEATDGTFLSALAITPLDAADPNTFLAFGWTVGQALEHQHVPTVVLAHWPSGHCEFAELLARVARRTPALGKWELVDDYFSNTDQPYHQERLSAANFRFPWLTAPSQVSGSSELASTAQQIGATQLSHQLFSRYRSLQNLSNLAWQLENFHRLARPTEPSSTDSEPTVPQPTQPTVDQPPSHQLLDMQQWAPGLHALAARIDALWDQPHQAAQQAQGIMAELDRLRLATLQRLAIQLHSSTAKRSAASHSTAAAASPGPRAAATSTQHVGRLLVNPRSAPIRVPTHTLPTHHLAEGESWHFAEGRVGEGRVTCVDIPPLGFVVSPIEDHKQTTVTKQRPLADAGGLLNNEFLEVQLDPARGHLRSLHTPAKRGNRLSLMIARRDQLPTPADQPKTSSPRDNKSRAEKTRAGSSDAVQLSNMVATNLQMLTSSNICGVIRTDGHLEMGKQRVARFQIDYELWRGSRILEVNIRLYDLAPLAADSPWQSAYVVRLAWPTDAAILRTVTAGQRHLWNTGQAISPTLIEIDEVDYRTHYLTGGLAFHRRTEQRFMETVLAVSGQTEVSQRIGIAVDLPHPNLAAEQFLDSHYELPLSDSSTITPASGWLANVDARNVSIELESPLVDSTGRLVGMRLFVSEFEGRATSAQVRLLRDVASAARVDYLGGQISKLTTSGDRVTIAARAHEQVNVDVLWSK